jgi:hypothetical protein
MKVNLTYRVTIRPSGRLLRIRIRREDGLSIVLLFPDPGHFEAMAQQANLSVAALQAIEDDAAVLAQMSESSLTRENLELGPEELQRLGATEWSDAQEFNLSFKRTSGGDELRITAREVNPRPGLMPLNVHTVIPKGEFQSFMSRISMDPSEVRDANMYGSQSGRRINEDEVESLFDAIAHV